MSISSITDRSAIQAAMAEFDATGRDAFLNKYGFGHARQYFLRGADGQLYDSKAVVGAAHAYQFPDQGPLRATDFSGGDATVKALLEQLGFTVTGPQAPSSVDAGTHHARRFWVEKTIVQGRRDRQAGPHRLGEALWSPQTGADGRDVYANMRDVSPGDVVLHLTDNEALTGLSWVAAVADKDFRGVNGTEWGDRPCYRIQLRDFMSFDPPLQRDWLFKDESIGGAASGGR